MRRWVNNVVTTTFLGLAGGCGGSGGCDDPMALGMEPIDGGFARDKRIENPINVRVTESGVDFLESAVPSLAPTLLGGGLGGGSTQNGVLSVEIPASSEMCPGGGCYADIRLDTMDLDIKPQAPHHLLVDATIPIRIKRLPVKYSIFSLDIAIANECDGNGFVNADATITIPLNADMREGHVARYGMTRIDEDGMRIDIKNVEGFIDDHVKVCGWFGGVMELFLGWFSGQFAGLITEPIQNLTKGMTCSSESPCPEGSSPNAEGVCMWDDGVGCAPAQLGLEGRMDMGALLSGFAPGLSANVEILAALGGEGERPDGSGQRWGDMKPANGGMTLSLMAGAEAAPPSGCVPFAEAVLPTGIPQPDEMTANTVADWTGDAPDFGVSLSEAYLNYLLAGMYNAGTLCLPIDGSALGGGILSADLLALALKLDSLKSVPRSGSAGGLSLMIRPQKPPAITLGGATDPETDPLMMVNMPDAEIDFYVFESDRYVRAFTTKFDLFVPLDLNVNADGEIEFAMGEMRMENASFINAPLLSEAELAPAAAGFSETMGGLIAGQLGDALPPIDVSGLLADFGLGLNIPPGGIRRLEKDGHRFLGIFSGLEPASSGSAPFVVTSQTSAEVVSSHIEAEGLVFATATDRNRPTFVVDAASSLDNGSQRIAYQWRLNGGAWRFWQEDGRLVVDDPALRLQTRHNLEVRSKVVGIPLTIDAEPAVLELIVDKTAPEVAVRALDEGVAKISVTDHVSLADNIQVRWSLDDEAFGEWVPLPGAEEILVDGAEHVTVEAKDEMGNVASQRQGLIRGRVDPSLAAPAGDEGCGCHVPGRSSQVSSAWGVGVLAALGLLTVARRRRVTRSVKAAKSRRWFQRLGGGALMIVMGGFMTGCSCSADPEVENRPTSEDPNDTSAGGSGGTDGTDGTGGGDASSSSGCPGGSQCTQVLSGVLGAYASTAAAGDGTRYVAAYSDRGGSHMEEAGFEPLSFGDLLVGTWDGSTVTWESVDGVPNTQVDAEYYDVDSFRGGVTDSGDNVGLWTSVAVANDGSVQVAYYDVSNKALKFASKTGDKWSVHTVLDPDGGDAGRYATLKIIDGVPTIAFLAVEGQADGPVHSTVRIAQAISASPGSAGEWDFQDAAVHTDTPCSKGLCPTGTMCREDNLRCEQEIVDPVCDCTSSQGCFPDGDGVQCVGKVTKEWANYPEASGLYISLLETVEGWAVVYYDRVHGNLLATRKVNATWQDPVILDGQNQAVDTGDTGIGASATVDAYGDWHITYSDGISESVHYMKVAGGVTPFPRETVDAGFIEGVGQSLLGDDSSVHVTDVGTVYVSYGDATGGKTRLATGTPNGDSHDWSVAILEVPGFSGGFSEVVPTSGGVEVMTWARSYNDEKAPHALGQLLFIKP